MRILIHGGVHRTGSTSLQRYLAGNRSRLARQGVRYPGEGVHHQKLVWAVLNGHIGVEDLCAAAETGEPQDPELVVLSAEDFSRAWHFEWLRELARQHDVEALFYLRRQDHWLMSWYNQHIQWPFDRAKSQMDPQTFLRCLDEFYWIDYDWLLTKWSQALGRENIRIGIVERGDTEDVLLDFADRVGIDVSDFEHPQEGANVGLPVHALEILRHLNMFDLPPKRRNRMLRCLRNSLRHIDPGARTVYSPEERNRILARFAETNKRVAEEFLGRAELFQESSPKAGDPYYVFPEMSYQELLQDWMKPIIHDLLKDVN